MADHFSNHPQPFGDTTWTKVFVGGLAWETQSEEMHRFFQHFGEILEAVIIKDKNTGKSKGYGFVTFRDPESARRACANPNPIICGRRANCNIAAFGRPRPPPPSGGRNQIGNPQSTSPGAGSCSGLRAPFPPPAPVIFPPYSYRYRSYVPNYTVPYHQAIYNPQLQQPQLYQQSPSSSPSSSSYYYGYGYGYSSSSPSSSQPPRGPFSSPSSSSASYFPYYTNYTHMHQGLFYTPMHQIITPSTGWQTPQHTPTETEAGASGSNSPNTS